MNRTVVAAMLVFVLLSAINFWYYRHNMQLIGESIAFLGTDAPTAEESAAADRAIHARMSIPGEQQWLMGREFGIVAVIGGALFFGSRRPKVAS